MLKKTGINTRNIIGRMCLCVSHSVTKSQTKLRNIKTSRGQRDLSCGLCQRSSTLQIRKTYLLVDTTWMLRHSWCVSSCLLKAVSRSSGRVKPYAILLLTLRRTILISSLQYIDACIYQTSVCHPLLQRGCIPFHTHKQGAHGRLDGMGQRRPIQVVVKTYLLKSLFQIAYWPTNFTGCCRFICQVKYTCCRPSILAALRPYGPHMDTPIHQTSVCVLYILYLLLKTPTYSKKQPKKHTKTQKNKNIHKQTPKKK